MDTTGPGRPLLTASHWGAYRAEMRDGRVVALRGVDGDQDPSPIAEGMIDTLDDPCRIGEPMVRESWLRAGPGAVEAPS